MLFLNCRDHKPLTATDIHRLVQILDTPEPTDIDEYLDNPDDKPGFYEFLYDELDEPERHRVIILDWKWHPAELFERLGNVLAGHKVTLVKCDNSQAKNMYSVTFEMDGDEHSLDVFDDYPDRILEYIELIIDDGKFLSINFGDDAYCWLYVPQGFDDAALSEFCTVTGCQIADLPDASSLPKKLSINPSGKQTVKIFFEPHIQVMTATRGKELPVTWAGRVLPGQTIEEGIATELKEVYGYTGRFTFRDIYFSEFAKDRKGRDIERYGLTITLHPSAEEASALLGPELDTEAERYDHFIDPRAPVAKKLFFFLHLYTTGSDGRTRYLALSRNGSQQYAADRVLPGDTLEQAITGSLSLDFGIDTWRFIHGVTFSDDTQDKKLRAVQRVNVYLGVPYFETAGKRLRDMDMHWIDLAPTAESPKDSGTTGVSRVDTFIGDISDRLQEARARSIQALVPFTSIEPEPNQVYSCFELWDDQDYALGYNKFFRKDAPDKKALTTEWTAAFPGKGSFLPELVDVFDHYSENLSKETEFTDVEDAEFASRLEAVLFEWFADCWKAAGGDNAKVPTFFCFEKEYKVRDLKTGEVLGEDEAAERLTSDVRHESPAVADATTASRLQAARQSLDATLIADIRAGQKKSIAELWPAFAAWLSIASPAQYAKLNPPATFRDFDEFARQAGYQLPDNLKQLYRYNDGGISGSDGMNSILSLEFLPVRQMISEWNTEREIEQGSWLDGDNPTYPAGAIRNTSANAKWIPFLYDGSGNHIGVDLDPGETGTAGQVINFGPDEQSKFVIADSLEDFIAFLLLQFADGNVGIASDEDDGWYLGEGSSHLTDQLRDIKVPKDFNEAPGYDGQEQSETLGFYTYHEYDGDRIISSISVIVERLGDEIAIGAGDQEIRQAVRTAVRAIDPTLDAESFSELLEATMPRQVGVFRLRQD